MKAFKSLEAYEFFLSGHVKPLWFHTIDEDVPFCFIEGNEAWVCLRKKEATVHAQLCT